MILRGLVWLIALSAICRAEGALAGATVSSLLGIGGSSPLAAQVQGLPPRGRPLGFAPRERKDSAQPNIHPAVVRVVAPGTGTISFGSGTLVDVHGDFGLVITNYHVINEATRNISVVFPDGFYSLARVRKIDRDWDLAALVIKRPNVQPVPLASIAPRPGDPLTIAGYGSGNYRAVAGRCTQYVAPERRMPFEMVELAATARQGDSGGPILNSRGELAGVLFGEGGGRTAGSYCGRVKWFLASLTDRPNPPASTPLPQVQPVPSPVVVAQQGPSGLMVRLPRRERPVEPDDLEGPANSFAARAIETRAPTADQALPQTGFVNSPTLPSLEPVSEQVSWRQIAGETIADQVTTFLAILGCVAVLMCALRIVGGGE